ncbi:MAG TPA: DUF1697 domain-containing protein [Thermoplasmata archaeon]|nr:DUF1697 domain-containing protein [Thermoplasmata archaeon]
MPTFVALWRAVNVGGRLLDMAQLRAVATRCGFADVRSLLRTGNLVFRADALAPRELESRLEAACRAGLGLDAPVVVRGAEELPGIRARNPFAEFAARDPSHLLVVFLKSAPPAAVAARFAASLAGPEALGAIGAHAYVTYPAGIGRSHLTLERIETGLGVRGTARNWNTLRRLEAMAGAPDASSSTGEGG